VIGLACVIGVEELLETSVVIAALRAQARHAHPNEATVSTPSVY